MRLALLLAFIAVPLIELALLIRLGQLIGLWPTLGLIVVTAIAGTVVLHRQGLATLERISAELQAGRPPLAPMVDGLFLLVAGLLLLTPGLITDLCGLALLLPAIRTRVGRYIIDRVIASGVVRAKVWRAGDDPGDRPRRTGPGTVIDGEYERIDDPPDDRKK